jgi:hypothetical protein
MRPRTSPLWRSFPWDPAAAENEPFSAAFVPPLQGFNRFDLPGRPAGVIYLAETPDHALGEWIARFRGRSLRESGLERDGRLRALATVELRDPVWSDIVDLCDPEELTRYRITPDSLAVRDRSVTQAIAERLHDAGLTGLRWWSALFGDWHTVVLFRDRLASNALAYGAPEAVGLSTPALVQAANWLSIRLVN